jgi:hypothetical protein
MVGRLLDTLRGLSGGATEPAPRPNELRREEVRAARLRREALNARTSPGRPPRLPEDHLGPRAPGIGTSTSTSTTVSTSNAEPSGSRPRSSPLGPALASRGALRRAWLVKEVLGPPRGFRPIDRELES